MGSPISSTNRSLCGYSLCCTLRLMVSLLICGCPALAQSSEPPLEQAASLLEGGNPNAALKLLLPYQASQEGLPRFDMLMARLYVTTGQLGQGLFALERILMLQPDHIGAQLLKAEIYVQSGDQDQAQQILSSLSWNTLTPKMQQRYRQIIKQITVPAPAEKRTKWRGQMIYTLGYDNNVTYGPNTDTLILPSYSLDNPTALDTLAKDGDKFTSLKLGGGLFHKLEKKTALLGGIQLSHHLQKERHDVTQGYANAYLGISRSLGKYVLTVNGLAQVYSYGDTLYRHHWGVQSSVQRALGEKDWLSGYIRYLDYTFPSMRSYDAEQIDAGIRRLTQIDLDGAKTTLSYGLTAGVQQAHEESMKYLGYLSLGSHVAVSYELSADAKVNAKLGFEDRAYKDEDSIYLSDRHDRIWTINFSASHKLAENWQVVPAVKYVHSKSNLPLYYYDQTLLTLSLQWNISHDSP